MALHAHSPSLKSTAESFVCQLFCGKWSPVRVEEGEGSVCKQQIKAQTGQHVEQTRSKAHSQDDACMQAQEKGKYQVMYYFSPNTFCCSVIKMGDRTSIKGCDVQWGCGACSKALKRRTAWPV